MEGATPSISSRRTCVTHCAQRRWSTCFCMPARGPRCGARRGSSTRTIIGWQTHQADNCTCTCRSTALRCASVSSHTTHSPSVERLYRIHTGFYMVSVLMLVMWETRRKDFPVMLAHHIVTLCLLIGSYAVGYVLTSGSISTHKPLCAHPPLHNQILVPTKMCTQVYAHWLGHPAAARPKRHPA